MRKLVALVMDEGSVFETGALHGRELVTAFARGDPEHALSRGYSCIKGRRIPAIVNHPDRLRSCLARVDGQDLEPIASEMALDEIAARLTQLIDRYGPRCVATYTGTGCWGNGALAEIV